MSIFPLSFGEVAETLTYVHLIMPDRTPALKSRIKDFQRREFPPGLNTGKGKPAKYEVDHLVLLAVALQLLELGMTPDRICRLLKVSAGAILMETRRNLVSESGIFRKKKNKKVIYFDPMGLSDLRDDDEFAHGWPGISIGTVEELSRSLNASGSSPLRVAVIDLYALISMLVVGLEDATEAANDDIIAYFVDWANVG